MTVSISRTGSIERQLSKAFQLFQDFLESQAVKVPTETDLQVLIRIIRALSQDTKIYIGENPPEIPEEGDLWYNPVEDRYYGYVKSF